MLSSSHATAALHYKSVVCTVAMLSINEKGEKAFVMTKSHSELKTYRL